MHIDIELTRGGRASGDAVVEFESDSDVREAMKRHREMIGLTSLLLLFVFIIIIVIIKGTSLHKTASFDILSVKIHAGVFVVCE